MKKTELKVAGMHCKSCKALIEDVLSEKDGVKKAEVSLEKGSAKVEFDDKKITAKQIAELITAEGYKAEVTK